MRELRPGFWHWQAAHPDWTPAEPWEKEVSSYEAQRAVVAGDSLVDFGRGLEIPREWLREGVTREQVADGLRPLLDLPVELVLPAHGAPTDRAALERALSRG